MQPNVVLKDLARRAASLVALLLMMLVPATAAERALINIIGYDQDSNYLAFEEYGESDGAGGYYDHIYVVDLNNDSWVKGAPFSFEDPSEDGGMPLAEVRAKAMALAAPTLKSLKIDTPAEILTLHGDGDLSDTSTVTWKIPNCCGADSHQDDPKYVLTLTTMPVTKQDASDDCEQFTDGEGPSLLSFKLDYFDGTEHTVLHADSGPLPKSRGCTLGYGIYAVIDNFETGRGRVAIIETWPFGFEGPDRRFMAVPIDSKL